MQSIKKRKGRKEITIGTDIYVCAHVCKVALVHVRVFASLWTVALQGPLSTQFYANKFEILHKIDTFFRKMKFSRTLSKPILQANRILNKV